jgi:hypothetical protein
VRDEVTNTTNFNGDGPMTEPETWQAELESVMTDLTGGLARRIEALAEAAPNDPVAFAALRRLTQFVRLNGPAPAVSEAVPMATSLGRDAAPVTAEALGKLLGAVTRRADDLLANRVNDPDAAILRMADFARTYQLTEVPFGGLVVADVSAGLPADHPAAGIAPYRVPGGQLLRGADTGSNRAIAGHMLPPGTPLLFLGRAPARWFWLASVQALTKQFCEAAAQREREVRRDAELEAAEARRQFEASPSGQQRRVRELEAQVAEMKAGNAK